MSEEVKRFDVLWSPGGYQLVPGDELVRADDFDALRAKLEEKHAKLVRAVILYAETKRTENLYHRDDAMIGTIIEEVRALGASLRWTGAGFEEDTTK